MPSSLYFSCCCFCFFFFFSFLWPVLLACCAMHPPIHSVSELWLITFGMFTVRPGQPSFTEIVSAHFFCDARRRFCLMSISAASFNYHSSWMGSPASGSICVQFYTRLMCSPHSMHMAMGKQKYELPTARAPIRARWYQALHISWHFS